jgi:fatty acid desaturase
MDRPSASSRHAIPARRNLLIIVLLLLATGAIFWLTAAAGAWWQVGLLALTFAVIGNSIYAIVHEAEHGMLHPNRRVNDGLGVMMALFFPAPFHLLRQGHLGHHLRNRSDDEAFDFYFDNETPLLKMLQLYGILTGLFYVTVVLANVAVLLCPWLLKRRHFEYDRPTAALMDSLNPRYRRAIWLEAAAVVVLHALIIWGLGIAPLAYAAVYFGFGLTWSAMQYVHHFDTERDVVNGARNLRLFAPIDWIWLHHNWHLTHHRHPTVPWIHLPQLGRAENPRRGFLLWHYLKMWRGPRRARDRVENRYAGRVIR